MITIIIVCRNAGATLPATLASVWGQTIARPRLELVVIDGASTDGSAAWLAEHTARIDQLISEPDAGVYDAMNRGLDLARGDWVYFLGADDTLASPDVLDRVALILRGTSADAVAGEARYRDGRVYRFAPPIRPARRNFLHHQATFYRRAHFDAFGGGFDLSFRVAADYELNLRWWRLGARFEACPIHVADCTPGGLSDAGRWPSYGEEIRARHRHLPGRQCLLWDAGSVVRYLRKRLIVAPRRHA